MLSDTQKQNLSAIAKGRSRDSKGRLLPTATAQESRIEVLEAEALTLSNALNVSRKISQERENQLTELRRLLRLSRMSDANARGILQQIRDYLGGDSDESALSKVERMYRESIDMEGKYESSIQLSKDACRERNEAVAELQAANLEIERLEIELAEGREQAERIVRSAQEQASISRVQFACTGLIIACITAGLAFFVGRWAR